MHIKLQYKYLVYGRVDIEVFVDSIILSYFSHISY